tara:strand:- start:528 stop:857 length:330 start_codon:yes stop_codon:yes gene_type:complete
MAAAKHNIIVARGEDFSFTLSASLASVSVNLAASELKAEIRRGGGKPLVASFDAMTDDGDDVVVGISKTETLKLDGNTTYEWDLFRTASGTRTRLIYGKVLVEDSITIE